MQGMDEIEQRIDRLLGGQRANPAQGDEDKKDSFDDFLEDKPAPTISETESGTVEETEPVEENNEVNTALPDAGVPPPEAVSIEAVAAEPAAQDAEDGVLQVEGHYQSIYRMRRSIRDHAYDYFHSTVLATVVDPFLNQSFHYVVRDIALMGAAMNLPLLLTGNTGCGKTMFANRMGIALFGNDGYVEKTITPGTREEDFIDLNFEKIKQGSTLAEAVEAPPVLTKGCVVINELNRMPKVVQNKLIPFFDYMYSCFGKSFEVGVKHSKGLYQFRIITINEGDRFGGTSEIDDAIRDRLTIEIPMDLFPMTRHDKTRLRNEDVRSLQEIVNPDSHLNELIELGKYIKTIPLSIEAGWFLEYLPGMNNCVNSNTCSKMGVDMRVLQKNLCRGCHNLQPDNKICPNIFAPSDRSIRNLKKFAQAFAMLRSYKLYKSYGITNNVPEGAYEQIAEPLVTTRDIFAAAPFVLYSKLNVNPMWVQKHCQGNRWEAVNSAIGIAYERFNRFLLYDRDLAQRYYEDGDLSLIDMNKLEDYATAQDAWAYKMGEQ